MKNKGLGRGLGAIFEVEGSSYQDNASDSGLMNEIPISQIAANPKQPRTNFDEDALEELADSIKSLGLIQPITVKRDGESSYTIISGERRWRASQLAGLESIPAYVREVDDQTLHEMSLVENIQREDLNAMEIAISLQRLMEECSLTQDTVAERVGKKRSTVANYIRLLSLPDEVQAALKRDLITMGHAKAIASAPEDQRLPALKRVIKKGLSVRQTEELVRKLSEGKPTTNGSEDDEFPESYTRLVERLSQHFSEDIKIKRSRSGGGKIVIGFSSDNDINLFLERLEELN